MRSPWFTRVCCAMQHTHTHTHTLNIPDTTHVNTCNSCVNRISDMWSVPRITTCYCNTGRFFTGGTQVSELPRCLTQHGGLGCLHHFRQTFSCCSSARHAGIVSPYRETNKHTICVCIALVTDEGEYQISLIRQTASLMNNFQILNYVLITKLMHKFLYLYNIPLHVSSNNSHLQEVTLLYTCSMWYHHSLGAVMVAAQYTDSYSICTRILCGHHDRS